MRIAVLQRPMHLLLSAIAFSVAFASISLESISLAADQGTTTHNGKGTVSAKDAFDQAMTALKEGNHDVSVSLLKKAHQASPDEKQFSLFLIDGLVKRGLRGEEEASEIVSDDDSNHTVRKVSVEASTPAEDFIQASNVAREVLEQNSDLVEAEKVFLARAIYQEARICAADKKNDRAISLLEEAFDSGFADFAEISTHADFASLREDDAKLKIVSDRKQKYITKLTADIRKLMDEQPTYSFNFNLPSIDGKLVSSDQFQSKILIADFWATWCGPCRDEIPHFVALKNEFADDLDIVGINYENLTSNDEAITRINQFRETTEMNYDCVIGDDQTKNQVPNFKFFPTTVFLDGDGKVRLTLVGPQSHLKLKTVVNVLMKERN